MLLINLYDSIPLSYSLNEGWISPITPTNVIWLNSWFPLTNICIGPAEKGIKLRGFFSALVSSSNRRGLNSHVKENIYSYTFQLILISYRNRVRIFWKHVYIVWILYLCLLRYLMVWPDLLVVWLRTYILCWPEVRRPLN